MYNQQMHQRIAERLSALRDASDTELNRVEEAVQRAKVYAEALLEEAREPLMVLDMDLRVVSVNRSFCQTFQVSPEEMENQLVYESGGGQWDIPQFRSLLERILYKETRVQDFELAQEFPTIGVKRLLINACRIELNSKRMSMILLTLQDVTELRQAEEALQQVVELRAANEELQKDVSKLKDAVEIHLQGREAAETQLKKCTDELQAADERLEKAAAERRQAEEEIRSLEELIENVFQSIQERLVAFGRDFRITTRDKDVSEI